MAARNLQPELMDDPGLAASAHRRALVGLSRVNWISGTVPLLWRVIRKHHSDRGPLRVLDIGSGGGDVLIGLAKRARRQGVTFSGQGCDISETALQHAREQARAAGFAEDALSFIKLNCLNDPFPKGFDVVLCSLFLHHFAEPDAVAIIAKMGSVARRLVLVDDLQRSSVGYALAWLGTRLLTRSAIVHTDGPRSVEGAFTLGEMHGLAESAGLVDARITRHWPHRMLLEWKPNQA